MASSDRDINLIIRAKNDASKAIDSVAEALKHLAAIQNDVGQSAGKADTLLGQLGSALADLQKQAQGLGALGVVATQIDRAAAAVERLENQAKTAATTAAPLAAAYQQAGQATADFAAKADLAKGALQAQVAATNEAKAALGSTGAAVAKAEGAYGALYNQLQKTRAPSEALKQSVRDQANALQALYSQQEKSASAYNAQKTALDKAKTDYAQLNQSLRSAVRAESDLQVQSGKANDALGRAQGNLEKARTELGLITDLGEQASVALGGVAANQTAVAEASLNAAQDLDKVKAALDRQTAQGAGSAVAPTPGSATAATAAYRAQVVAVKEAQAAYNQARAAASALGAELARTDAPTKQLSTHFLLAKEAAASAKAEFLSQAQALNQVRGVTQGGISSFLRLAETMDRESAGALGFARAMRDLPPIAPRVERDTQSLRVFLAELFKVPVIVNEAGEAVAGFGVKSERSFGILGRMRNEIIGLSTAYIGFYGAISQVGGLIKTIGEVSSVQSRLSVVFNNDTQKAKSEMDLLFATAERLGIPFNELSSEFTRTSIAAKDMGLNIQTAQRVFIALAEAGRVNSLSTSEMQGVFLGLSRSIDRGIFSARNFDLEIGARIPGSMKAMAAAAGVTVQKMEELRKSGTGLAVTDNILLNFSDNLKKLNDPYLAQSMGTINAQIGRMKTLFQEAQVAIGEGGFTSALKDVIDSIDHLVKDGDDGGGIKAIGGALAGLAKIIAFAVAHFGDLVKIIEVFISLKIAQGFLSMTSGTGIFATAIKAATADVARFEASLAGLNAEKIALSFRSMAGQTKAFGASLIAIGPEAAAAAAGTTLLEFSLATLRGLMIGVAATARAMWVAIGGFPGLLITGLTFVVGGLLGDLVSGVDKATAALDAHEATLEKIRSAYQGAAGDAKRLAEELNKIDYLKEVKNNKQLHSQLNDAQLDLGPTAEARNRVTSLQIQVNVRGSEEMKALLKAFEEGRISAAQLRDGINELAKADPHLDQNLAAQVHDAADALAKLQQATKESDAQLVLMKNPADAAAKAILGIKDASEALSMALNADDLQKFNDGLREISKLDPTDKANTEKQKALDATLQAFKAELANAKLTQQQIDAVATKGPNVPGLPNIEQVKQAYAAYEKTIAGIAAEAEHKLAQGLPNDNIERIRQRIEKIEGTAANRGADGNSHAAGFGQFQPETWLKLFDTVFPELATQLTRAEKLQYRFVKGAADKVLDESIRENQLALVKGSNGRIQPTDANTYLAHFLGAGAAIRVLLTNPEAIAAHLYPADAAANPSVFYRGYTKRNPDKSHPLTVGDLERWAATKIGAGSPILSTGETAQEKFDRELQEFTKALQDEAKALGVSPRDAFIQSKVGEQEKRAQDQSAKFSPAQRASVTAAAGSEFDQKQDFETGKKNADLELAINAKLHGDVADLTRAEFVANEARKDGVNILSEQGKKYVELQGKLFDLASQQKAFNSAIGLSEQVKSLQGQIKSALQAGDSGAVAELQTQLADVVKDLREALPDARAFALATGDQKMSAQLDKVDALLRNLKVHLVDAKEINTQLADGIVGAFDKMAQSLGRFITGTGKLKDVLRATRDAFLQFAGDFIKHIAEMILKQQLMNLLQHSPIVGWIAKQTNALVEKATSADVGAAQVNINAAVAGAAAFASTAAIPIVGPALAPAAGAAAEAATLATYLPQVLVGLAHAGGVIGAGGAGQNRSVGAWIFDNARKMHGGGIVGLSPDEVPTILKRNEEVLTESDSRHAFNGGKGPWGARDGSPSHSPIKVVNAFDPADVLKHALQDEVGQKVLINHVRQNSGALNAALGTGAARRSTV